MLTACLLGVVMRSFCLGPMNSGESPLRHDFEATVTHTALACILPSAPLSLRRDDYCPVSTGLLCCQETSAPARGALVGSPVGFVAIGPPCIMQVPMR